MKFRDFLAREWNFLLALIAAFSLLFIYPYIPTAKSEREKQRAELDNINGFVIGKEYDKAEKYLKYFIGKYPDSSFTGEAKFLLGKTYYGIAKNVRFSTQILDDAVSNLEGSLKYEIAELRKEINEKAIDNLIRIVSQKIKEKVDDEKIRAEVKMSDKKYDNAYQSIKSFIERRSVLYDVAILLRDNYVLDKARGILREDYFKDKKSAFLDIAFSYGMEPTPIIEKDKNGKDVNLEKYYVDEYLKMSSDQEKVDGYITQAKILYLRKNYVEANGKLESTRALTKDSAKLTLILLEQGKILLRLGYLDKAIDALKRVQAEAVETEVANSAIFYLAEAYIKNNNPSAEDLLASGLINNNSSLASIAELSLGRLNYQIKKSSFIQNFKDGFEIMRDLSLITKYEVEIGEIGKIIKNGWESESNMEHLQYYEPTYLALKRLYGSGNANSVDMRYMHRWIMDLADFYKKIADMYKAESNKSVAERDFQKANEYASKANGYFSKASAEYDEITKLSGMPLREQAIAYKDSADMLFSAKRFDEASDKYSTYAGIIGRPTSQFGRLMQARSLVSAGRFAEAISVFDECIRGYEKSDEFTKMSIVEKAKMQIYIGNYADAVDTLKILLDDQVGAYGATPLDSEWERALYLSGVAYFELSKSQRTKGENQRAKGETEKGLELIKDSSTQLINARKKFLEFLDRYAAGGQKVGSLSLNVAYYTAISYVIENNWDEALGYFNRAMGFGGEAELSLEPEQKDLLKRAYFYVGDMNFNLGKYAEARKAYEIAYRRYIAEKEKLWGLIGVAKCYLKIDNVDEAARWYEVAKGTFESFKGAYESAPKDFGADFWMKRLSDLKEDIDRKKTG